MLTSSNTPWEHHIIDDFLSPEEISIIDDMIVDWPKPSDRFHMRLQDFKFFTETMTYYAEAMFIYEMFVSKVPLFEDLYNQKLYNGKNLFVEYVNINNYRYRPHTDAVAKNVSNVLYFSENGCGTRLAKDEEMNDPVMVEWKRGRMFSFQNSKEKWHDYFQESDEQRVTFNMCFLHTNQTFDMPNKSSEQYFGRI